MFKKLMLGMLLAVMIAISGMNATAALAAPAGTAAGLTSAESAGLLYMYEEEKLARDVYNALYEKWGQSPFQNIAASEQLHMNALETLLVRYGISVPRNTPGVFNDAALQTLYTRLMAAGSTSLAEALRTGALIEETDIADLQTRSAQTTSADIQRVYNNLLNGSYSHLRSFVGVLTQTTGSTYVPQVLSAEAYQSILSGTNGRGRSGSTPVFSGSALTATCTTAGTCTGTSTGTSTVNRGYRGGR